MLVVKGRAQQLRNRSVDRGLIGGREDSGVIGGLPVPKPPAIM